MPGSSAALILSGATGALALLTCIVVQVLSRQPVISDFRIIWDVLGRSGTFWA
jgi:hypothetical protein